MFRIFSKKPKAAVDFNEVVVMDEPTKGYPKIVQEIHNEFLTAGDRLLAETNLILQECEKVDKAKGDLLNAVGFLNVPEAITSNAVKERERVSLETAHLINNYLIQYPAYKFITEAE